MTSPLTHAPNRSRDEMVSAARKKLKTFRAKQGHSPMSSLGNHSARRSHSRGSSISSLVNTQQSTSAVSEATRHAKRRSHSRSASILKLDAGDDSSSMTLPSFIRSSQPESKPANLGGLNRSFSFGGSQPRPTSAAPVMVAMPSSPVRAQQSPARPRPSSHHRRRSSMSTRRESVDMMGFDPATLGALKSVDDPIKDDVAKVRERALLALEGKAPRPGKARTVPEIVPSLSLGFSKVEIPDWKTPDVERTFDWTLGKNNKPASFSLGLNSSIAGKRDSFGKNLVASSSTKAELSVLVEEEEEEEESTEDKDTAQASVALYVPGALSAPVDSPTEIQPARSPSPSSRTRPASLNLKALAQASAITALPTPSPTPSPTPRSLPGMKPLNLGNGTTYAARRQSMMALGGSSPRSSLPASRRQSLRSESRGSGSTHSSRDSLGQGTLINRLPPTPATGSPTSLSSAAAGVDGFLQKNQELLISRIDQLEKALAKSQRLSGVSDTSSVAPTLAEEQIALIADLKGERNTLVEDVASYRARVSDLERQAALYAKRVESERREAFAARERTKELEVERSAWETDRTVLDETIVRAREDAAAWRGKFEEASKGECHWHARAVNLEADVRRLEKELANARMAQYAVGPTASPSQRRNAPIAPRRFDGSVSSASTTDVEDASATSGEMDVFKIRPRVPSPLPNMDVVVEEEEEVYEDSYEEPSLDEDEEESHGVEEDEEDVDSDILDEVNGDMTISYSMDSFTSPSARATELAPPVPVEPTVPGAFPAPAPASHARTGSMVRGWQMPRGPVAVKKRSAPKPDCFFDQLEHLYASSEDESAHERAVPAFEFGSPELGMVKGDGGAGAFTFGTRRSVMGGSGVRGHGTRASRASISVGAFDGCGMPPFMNPKPEWIVKTEVAESKPEIVTPHTGTAVPVSNTVQAQVSSAGSSPDVSRPCPPPRVCDRHDQGVADQTPTMTRPPKFIAAPTTRIASSSSTNASTFTTRPSTSSSRSSPSSSSTHSSMTTRPLVRRKPSLTRAQPTGRAPPRVPFDTSNDKPRSPYSISYSRTSSRSSGSRASIAAGQAEAAAIETAIAQAQAQAQSRLTLAGLTSFLPWSGMGLGNGVGTGSVELVAARASEERRSLVRHESGRVSREAQLARLRAAGPPRALSVSSGPCCTRCRSDVIEL